MSLDEKRACVRRARLIAGQADGIAGMIDAERTYGEIQIQILALRGALQSLENSLMLRAVRSIIVELIDGDAKISPELVTDELYALLRRKP